jgi:hypothetical protein
VSEQTRTAAIRYRFPLARRGVWLGLRPGQLAALGSGLAGSVLVLHAGGPLPLGLIPLGLSALLALLPIAGRPALDWAAPAARHTAAAAAAADRWRLPTPTIALGAQRSDRGQRLPAEYGRLRLIDTDVGGEQVGLVAERGARTLTVVLATAGAGRFALLDPDEQARLLAGWGGALAELAGQDRRLRRLQWVERTRPADGESARAWMSAHSAAPPDDAERVDYDELVTRAAGAAVHREVLLAVQVRPQAGIRSTEAATEAASLARHVAGRLFAAELVARPLDGDELGAALAATVRPDAAVDPSTIGPQSRRVGWDHLRTDEFWHRSYAIAAWPRLPVGPTFLEPLLRAAPAGARRSIAVHLQPVPPAAAMRSARAARTRAQLDRADRSRLGMVDSATADRNAADTVEVEEELTAGYASHRVAGLITCTAEDRQRLDEACRQLRAAAVAAHLELAPLHGQQDQAFVAGLPLCRLRMSAGA